MKTPARAKLVRERLVQCLDHEIGAIARPMTRFEWLATSDLSDPSNLHRPYGWIPPHEVAGAADDDFATVIAPFCPGLIAEQTRFLLDEAFLHYVDTIEYQLCLHIVHRDLPWQEREALIDKQLWETAPGSMELQNRVQLRILDQLSDA